MITVAFRRLRFEATAVAIALAAVGALALITGRAMHHEYDTSGLGACLSSGGRDECQQLMNAFSDKFNGMQVLIVPLILLPALFGAFVGGPLVARDVEAGTHRFFWTQSITRGRWLASSTAALMAAALAAGLIFAVITGVWLDIVNRVTDDRFAGLYDLQGVVPVAATVMAAALGVLAGAMLRRTVAAMAVTVAGFIAIRLVLALFVRPRLMSPKVLDLPFGPDALEGTGAWILSETAVDPTGTVLGTGGTLNVGVLTGKCDALPIGGPVFPGPDKVNDCLQEMGVRNVVEYQPGSRFWTFQIVESLIMVGIGAVALGAAFWFVRRRIS